VSEAVWPWRTRPAGGADAASARRKSAAIEGSITLVVGLAFLLLAHGHKKWMGAFVLFMSTLVWIGGFAVPPLYAALKRFGLGLGKAVGVAFSWILLVPFFYLFFTTAHAFLAMKGRDPLSRKFDAKAGTYWSERRPNTDLNRYTRQY
jgi:hypothetical protein